MVLVCLDFILNYFNHKMMVLSLSLLDLVC